MNPSVSNAFTCSGAYALLVMTGLKRVENRHSMPFPRKGRCAVGVSKKFRKPEYDNLMLWLKGKVPDSVYAAMPQWNQVENWPGHIVGTIDYWAKGIPECTPDDLAQRQIWNEGYFSWWHLSNPRALPEPLPCRGCVGFWKLPADLAEKINAANLPLQ